MNESNEVAYAVRSATVVQHTHEAHPMGSRQGKREREPRLEAAREEAAAGELRTEEEASTSEVSCQEFYS